jgi:hypothetical protein
MSQSIRWIDCTLTHLCDNGRNDVVLQVRHRIALWYCCHECKPEMMQHLTVGEIVAACRSEKEGDMGERKEENEILKSVLKSQ